MTYLSVYVEGLTKKELPGLNSFIETLRKWEKTNPKGVGERFDCGCVGQPMIPGAAQIVEGINAHQMGCTAEISGGTTMFSSPFAGVTMMVVEQLGNGFLFVTGDSNHWSGCDFDNCELVRRLYKNGDNEII